MKALTALAAIVLTACSSTPPQQTLIIDKEVQHMSRNEVITAINECEGNHTRAVMVYAKRKINGFTADVVVEVTCAPRYFTRY
jgi:protein involved in sex pheromone biosynthesis